MRIFARTAKVHVLKHLKVYIKNGCLLAMPAESKTEPIALKGVLNLIGNGAFDWYSNVL